MLKFLYSNRLIISVITGAILIVVGGTYYLNHHSYERKLEKERNIRLDYKQWHLPEGVKARIGSGTISKIQYSPDGNLLAVVSSIGVWILNEQTAEPRHLIAAHSGVINSISFSPDVNTLAVGTENGTVQIWDITTGELLKTFTTQEYISGVENVFFLPDGRTLIVMSSYKVDLWDVAKGQLKKTLSAIENRITDYNVNNIPSMSTGVGSYKHSIRSDGIIAASSSYDGTCHLWNIAKRKKIRTFKVGSSRFSIPISFSSDLGTLASANRSIKGPMQGSVWEINLWDVNSQTQQKIHETDDLIFEIPFLVFSPDGNLLACFIDNAIQIWDVNTGRKKKRLKGHKNVVSTVAFSSDNRTLVSASYDNTIRVWDVDTGKEKKELIGYGGAFREVSLSADTQLLSLSGIGTGVTHLWNTNTGQHENTFIKHKKPVWGGVLSSDGSKFANHSLLKKTIHLWDVNTGKLIKLNGPRNHVSGIKFSRDGKMLASWGLSRNRKYNILHYDVETGDIQRTLQLKAQEKFSGTEDIFFDKEMFAGIGKFFDPNLFVWNLVTGDYDITDLEDSEIGGGTEISVGRFSSDGRILAIVYGGLTKYGNHIILRDVKTGEYIRTLIGHTHDIESLAFSPDSQILASGGEFREKTIRLWNIDTGSSKVLTDPSWKLSPVKFDAAVASSLAFSSDGQMLASGMKLGDIYLWDTATGEKKRILRGHSKRISHLFFSPDGKTLISKSDDGTVLIWELAQL
ncbi:hypothetical protein JT359_15770 [Candidatus Poribacteria bacterium]|nr:hypothetical protein [Candidatus Poribacteria bacterium]